jgi:hypothetical protein
MPREMRHVTEHVSSIGKHEIFQISTDRSAMLAEVRGVCHIVSAHLPKWCTYDISRLISYWVSSRVFSVIK